MPPATAATERLISLDAFRGCVIIAMIWVNYLAGMPGIPWWLEHAGPRADGITLPDLVFPGFLFMVGMAIPLAMQRHCGHVTPALLGRLLWRSASLMLAGVVLANAYRYDAQAALLPRAPYFLLFYVAMLLLWRQGALMGAAPEQAFFVKCDEETNPQEEIDAGKVTTLIGIAPVKPAEFVIFRIGQTAAGAVVETA